MTTEPVHFPGCHPDHTRGTRESDGPAGLDEEKCWHCGTLTPRGCHCPECLDGIDYVPPAAAYHCSTCGRWWAWMSLVVEEIGAADQPGSEPS
jgi:hypothetical protein